MKIIGQYNNAKELHAVLTRILEVDPDAKVERWSVDLQTEVLMTGLAVYEAHRKAVRL